MDWNSLPIYDTHFNYENHVEVIFFHVIKKLTEITIHVHYVFDEIPKRKVSQLGLVVQGFLNKILMFVSLC